MRVLHVTPTYAPAWRYGGPIRSVHGLCKALAGLGVEVQVFTTNVDGPGRLDVPVGRPVALDSVQVRYFDSAWPRRLYFSPSMAAALRAELRHFDLVHLHSVFLWPTWCAARNARAQRVPYIVSPRGMLVRELVQRKSTLAKKAWIALIERRNLEHAAAVHATSGVEADEIARFGFRLRRVAVVPNAVEPAEGEAAACAGSGPELAPDASPFVLFLGRISWKKGLDRLLAAFAGVPGARLLIAGNDDEGYVAKLRARAAELGLLERVSFAGPVDGPAKARLYRHAALLVLPSYSENFGNVVLEAMAEGCPVVVTREVGAAAVVERSGAGLVVAGEPAALAGALNALLLDPLRRAAMGRAGRACVFAEYTWPRVASLMLDCYEQALADRC